MRSGDLRTKLVYQTKTETADGAGGYIDTWADTYIVVNADIRALSAKEQLSAEKHEHEITHRIFARRDAAVTTKGRFRHYDYLTLKNRYFEITSLILKGKRGQDMEILAIEVEQ